MRNATLLAPWLVLSLACGVTFGGETPKRLKRAESFLGIHYDFHAGPDCKEIGKNTTREMVENIINQVRPDYLQIDCKGHRGLSSYPTKVGNPAPGFVGDPLRTWREVTAEKGVALYMHYSGVWDSEAILRHPDWGTINSDGKTNGNATSFFSPYAERLLIPQLRELAEGYEVDGVWLDGECWASVPDYGPAAIEAFRKKTGIGGVPRAAEAPHWFEWLEFNREQFRIYVRHYITELKKTNPEFQLCSNWAFTDHMPEPVSLPLDFLSGDYSPDDSVNSARLSARYLARQGVPWDLMAWSFSRGKDKKGNSQKTAVQLQREAAIVLALGGGFQAYFKQKRDGSVFDERVPVMAEVATFCRERQAVCHHAVQVPQIAVVLSTPAHYRLINGLFSRDQANFRGTLESLIESRQSVELLGEHHLVGRLRDYPLIVIPEWGYLEDSFKQELLRYVKAGGNLLLVGPQSAAPFEPELGVKAAEAAAARPRLVHEGATLALTGEARAVTAGADTRSFGELRLRESEGAPFPAATWRALGKGKIAATWFSYSRAYLQGRPQAQREYLAALVHQLFPEPLVEVKGEGQVDLVVNRIDGKLAINLVNTAGPHETEPIIESIAPTGQLLLSVRATKKPSKITLAPAGQPLKWDYQDGRLSVEVPPVRLYDIVLVE